MQEHTNKLQKDNTTMKVYMPSVHISYSSFITCSYALAQLTSSCKIKGNKISFKVIW